MQKVDYQGFDTIPNIYTHLEIDQIIELIDNQNAENENFRRSSGLFAIRAFLKEIPSIKSLLFNDNLISILNRYFDQNYFVTKAIYFDKPAASNWFVSYHQDLSISVNQKAAIPEYSNWTQKLDIIGVQPPLKILEKTLTIRIHLDNTTSGNGALRVIPNSHNKGIYRPETINWDIEKEVICDVAKGGVFLMKPLLLHSSKKTTNNQRRRVIHLEFNTEQLATPLEWAEKILVG